MIFFDYFRKNLDCRKIQPNDAHKKLAELEKAGKLFGMDRMQIYHAEDFLTELENRYTEVEKNYFAKYGFPARKPGVTKLRKLLPAEEELPAAVQFFTEQPAVHTTPFTKAFPDLRDAAKAVIALKNYRKL